jgi:H+/gluconate symporter-like permease
MLVAFAVCAALMAARRLPAILAVPLMALAIAALAGEGPAALAGVVVDGTVRLAPVIATVVFGALLSRVTMQTGIAETIVSYAAEFGGDRPIVVAFVMAGVVAALFTSLYGLGAIIMVGSIVLPIMMTVGIPRRTAATLFLLAYALGFIFNISQWKFYTQTFGVERAAVQPFAIVLAAIDAAVLIAFVVVHFRRTRGYATWSVAPEEPIARKKAPALALIAPILPIVLYFAFGMNPIVAFALAALYGALLTSPADAVRTLVSAAIRGVEDVAPAVLLFMGIGMLLVATGLPAVNAALKPVVTAIAPHHPVGYIVLFGLLSPLALYRGPLNPYGVGIGVYTVLAGLGILPPVTLVAAVMAVVQVQNACDPTNTQNVWVANFTGVDVDEITTTTLPYQVAVATLATAAVAAFGAALFGAPVFAHTLAPVAAATIAPSPFPGLLAPPSAARTIAIVQPRDALAARAADEIARQIGAGWDGYKALRLDGDPPPGDCADKAYAAILRASSSPESLTGPVDVGLQLSDCADWPVDEWYVTQPRGADAAAASEAGALALLVRLRTWIADHPERANALFAHGLDRAPGAPPTYLYTLFKTADGQMRAYVRPGGPAYAAGLRTNDVVQKIDGRYWWEYGTYTTERIPYDGKPHAFDLMRGARTLDVRLGDPFSEE